MAQTVLTAVVEVQPKSASLLRDIILKLREDQEQTSPELPKKYDRLKAAVPALHFMSMTIFRDAHYDPIFVLEANFDGPPGPFWAQLEAAIGPQLRNMLRCCERPSGRTGAMFDAITAPGSRQPLAPFLEAQTVRPMIFHQGNRGLDRERILREAALFFAARDELKKPDPYRHADAVGIHKALRAAMRPNFRWLDEAAPPRIPGAERAADLLRLAGFAVLALFCLSIPGLLLALAAPAWVAVLLPLVAAAAIAARLDGLRDLLRQFRSPTPSGEPAPSLRDRARPAVGVVLFLALYVAVLSAIAAALIAPFTPRTFAGAFRAGAAIFALGLASVPFTALAILLWLRWLEGRDPSQDESPLDPEWLREITRREDRIVQNHMGSMVLVKPGVLRAVLIRAGLWGLGLLLRVTATSGYLGSMRTIHFAHWALVSNGGRLMFFSNFDGSWESYLDDFIEKAHAGLTLAWGNCVGFPPARFLVLEGATHGRKFKDWARHSQTVSLFWFSAYPDYIVNQIERHARVADGLRRATLSPQEATAWARDL